MTRRKSEVRKVVRRNGSVVAEYAQPATYRPSCVFSTHLLHLETLLIVFPAAGGRQIALVLVDVHGGRHTLIFPRFHRLEFLVNAQAYS